VRNSKQPEGTWWCGIWGPAPKSVVSCKLSNKEWQYGKKQESSDEAGPLEGAWLSWRASALQIQFPEKAGNKEEYCPQAQGVVSGRDGRHCGSNIRRHHKNDYHEPEAAMARSFTNCFHRHSEEAVQ